jgi:hypothetical protein
MVRRRSTEEEVPLTPALVAESIVATSTTPPRTSAAPAAKSTTEETLVAETVLWMKPPASVRLPRPGID